MKKKVKTAKRRRPKKDAEVEEVRKWFSKSVTYEGEPYVVDAEQAAAVVDKSNNAIVVARAGSGKTRTIVAKIVYLVARCGIKPEEIMVFVFNANAAAEINSRLKKMVINGAPLMGVESEENEQGGKRVRIATTFHAFSRRIVYDVCGGKESCGKILAGEKEGFILAIVKKMLKEQEWMGKIVQFMKGGEVEVVSGQDPRGNFGKSKLDEKELLYFVKMMVLFVNRAQQKYLGGDISLGKSVREYLANNEVDEREKLFVELGRECYKRYHWYLLDEDGRGKLGEFEEYGTDFNLIVSWASKLIREERGMVRKLLEKKKYVLIDEYQDFSQLFLAAVLAVRKVAREAKLFVVGDDWQAINRFAGSEVEYFKGFERYFVGDARRLLISTNYRCDKMIVETARRFVAKSMKEKGEFVAASRRMGKVVIVDPKLTELKYARVEYDRRVSRVDKIYYNVAWKMTGRIPERETVGYLKTLVEVIRKNRKADEILILHRNNETNIEGVSLVRWAYGLKMVLGQLEIMDETDFDVKVRIMTMHKSKGLEAEVVIIMEADEGVIPKTHPDTRLFAVFGETEKVALEDQKRLFYVAMTRAKRRLYLLHNDINGPGFIGFLGKSVGKWEF